VLRLEHLTVEVQGKQILHDVNLHVATGDTHALFGPNGSGKTTLLMTIMGLPQYKVSSGKIIFKDQDITDLPTDERARMGIGMSFQRPPVIRGVKTKDLIMASARRNENQPDTSALSEKLHMTDLMDREVDLGFSGGEIKRSELMQLMAQAPDLVLLDEPESGVDLVNISLIGKMTNELLQKDLKRTRTRSGLIITHTGHILDYVHAGRGYVLINGRVIADGESMEILSCIRKNGFEECGRCRR